MIYGPGGVGKTSLAALLAKVGIRPRFIDLEQRSGFLDVSRVECDTWEDMRDELHSPAGDFGAVIVDSGTKAEELATAWTLTNILHEKGYPVTTGINGYGFGKGLTHVYETFLNLIGDLDTHIRAGRHAVLICHDCVANVPNPAGEDWKRYEPRLQSPESGKASIRHRVKEWADHVLFVTYDVAVSKLGKAEGSGSRTIYPAERATWWAKSTKLVEPIVYEKNDPAVWQQLFAKGNQ